MTKYACICADPPWNEKGGGKIKRGADRHYPLLTVPQIIETVIACPLWTSAKDSHLYLWTTSTFLPAALMVLDALGFRYVTDFVWVKAKPIGPPAAPPCGEEGSVLWKPGAPGLGQYRRGTHEHLLLGVRGRLKRLDTARSTRSTIWAPATKHSAKPEQAYQAMERITPGPRAELFACGPRPGWDCWGRDNEGTEQAWRSE